MKHTLILRDVFVGGRRGEGGGGLNQYKTNLSVTLATLMIESIHTNKRHKILLKVIRAVFKLKVSNKVMSIK